MQASMDRVFHICTSADNMKGQHRDAELQRKPCPGLSITKLSSPSSGGRMAQCQRAEKLLCAKKRGKPFDGFISVLCILFLTFTTLPHAYGTMIQNL